MTTPLPVAGAASPELYRLAHKVWAEAAQRANVDMAGWCDAGSLDERLAWAHARGLLIGGGLSRYSSKLQHSTTAQVEDCLKFAGQHGIYVPPEFICVDEGVSGRKVRRDGLDRMRHLLRERLVKVLLVFKVSRLFRVGYKGFQFFQEEVVEEGLRAISISQGIDTAEEKVWKQLAYLHGIMDEMLLSTIADHVRSGISSLFRSGYVTGALPVGYFAQVVAGAPATNRGRPRTMPAVSETAATLIREHYGWILDGMPIKEGWRRWVQAGGPYDPRSTSGHMTYPAYRRLLSNPRYTGQWAFGRRRNQWSSKLDYTRQVLQPETEVVLVVSEELRIVDDLVFNRVQEVLAGLKQKPRGPKRKRDLELWDLVTDCFSCDACSTPERDVRFYQAGANGQGMRCKHETLCPQCTIVRRKDAVRAVCQALSGLLLRDVDLLAATIAFTQELDAAGDESLQNDLQRAERAVAALTRKIDDLTELAGEGSKADRAALKDKIRAAQATRTAEQAKVSQLQQALRRTAAAITPERVREIVADLSGLLEAGSSGRLGGDVVYRAANLFRQLVGGRIGVSAQTRPGRKMKNVRGEFYPVLLQVVQDRLDDPRGLERPQPTPVSVWLRQPPRVDALAQRVHQLIDLQGHSFRSAAAQLQADDPRVTSASAWQSYQRYYEMLGQPAPDRPFNNGHPRASG